MGSLSGYYTKICTIFLCVLLFSCTSGKPIETFFLLDGNQLYFIRPSDLKYEDGDISMDMTYNTTKGKDVTCNFSVISSSERTTAVTDLFFCVSATKDTIKVQALKRLFAEEDITRYTSSFKPDELKKLIECASKEECPYTIFMTMNGQKVQLNPKSSFKKAMLSAYKAILWE